MVGLAGEDHLDAPELRPDAAAGEPRVNRPIVSNGQASVRRPRGRRKKEPADFASSTAPELVPQLEEITDADTLLRWALDALPQRNRLSDEERERLDAAFLARAQALGAEPALLLASGVDPLISATPATSTLA